MIWCVEDDSSIRDIEVYALTSTGFEAKEFAPWKEVDWAIGYIREHAEEWYIDPSQIVTCGFSAGGHVAFAAGLMGENKPNAMVLNYPAVQLPNLPGVDYMIKLLTGKDSATEEVYTTQK